MPSVGQRGHSADQARSGCRQISRIASGRRYLTDKPFNRPSYMLLHSLHDLHQRQPKEFAIRIRARSLKLHVYQPLYFFNVGGEPEELDLEWLWNARRRELGRPVSNSIARAADLQQLGMGLVAQDVDVANRHYGRDVSTASRRPANATHRSHMNGAEYVRALAPEWRAFAAR